MGHPAGEPPDRLHLLGLQQLALEAYLVGDVTLDGHVVDEPAGGVAHGPDRRVFLEQRAVLAPVHQPALPDFSAGQGVPHAPIEGRVLVTALEHPGVLTQGLGPGVARDALEGRVHVDHGSLGIGDHDGLRGLLDDPAQARLLFLRSLALRDVDGQADQAFCATLFIAQWEPRSELGLEPLGARNRLFDFGAGIRIEHREVVATNAVGDLRGKKVVGRLADRLVSWHARESFPGCVDQSEAAFAVLHEDDGGQTVQDRLEELLLLVDLRDVALGLAEVLGEHQLRTPLLEEDVLRGHARRQQLAVFATVPPERRSAQPHCLRSLHVDDQGGDVLLRPDVRDGHP